MLGWIALWLWKKDEVLIYDRRKILAYGAPA